jgi:hypothetical protein
MIHLDTVEYYSNFRIHTIEGYAFAGTEHISMLVINDNPIKIVDSFAFAGLKHVKFLLLSSSVKHLHTVSGLLLLYNYIPARTPSTGSSRSSTSSSTS